MEALHEESPFRQQLCSIDEQRVSDLIDDIKKDPQPSSHQQSNRTLSGALLTPSQTKQDSQDQVTTGRQTNKENYQANNKQPQTKSKSRPARGKSPLKQVTETTVQQFQP